MARISDEQILNDFEKHCKLREMTPRTVENYMSVANIYTEFLHRNQWNIVSVQGIASKKILEDFLAYLGEERENSYARIKIYFSALNTLYGFLQYNGHVKSNIVLTVRSMYVRSFKNGYRPPAASCSSP